MLRWIIADVLLARRFHRRRPRRDAGGRSATPRSISASRNEVWKHTDLIIDVVPGRGGMFSLDNGRERRFLTRSTICAAQARA
ncbi:DUF779 domain-containing protein [Mesorhizobium sp. B2-5-4]|uniref:DUF779 domain-containing protein n=1 Tax=Mesorhizobium sp. B2-5-4 TaxID=2589926 RepID=UPI0032B17F5C